MIAYSLINNHKIRVKEFDFSSTKAGAKLTKDIEVAKSMFNKSDCTTVYEIKSYASKEETIPKKLLSWINKMGPGDVIIMPWLPKLPVETVINIFEETYKKHIGIAIFDDGKLSKYSTVRKKGSLVNKESFQGILQLLQNAEIKGSNGRMKATDIPEHFEEIYWQFENYFISREEAYHNKYFNCGNSKWNRLCALYESSAEYREAQLEQEKLHNISSTPKRSACQYLTTEEVNAAYRNDKITEIDKKRMVLKIKGGKKEMFKLSSRYNNNKN